MPSLDETTPLLQAEGVKGAAPEQPVDPEVLGDVETQGRTDDATEDEAAHGGKLLLTALPMAIGVFLVAMDGTIVASSAASIGSELKQLQNTSWIASAYMLTMTSFQPLYGKLSDIFGRKTCLLFAYTVFALGCLWCGLARSMPELIAARALAGIGGGGMSTVVSIIMSDLVPLRNRGTWQGILNIVWASGSATGAPLGGFLADTIGWRWAFLIQVPATLLAFASVSLALHMPHASAWHTDLRAKLRRIDFAGSAALVGAVFLLIFGLDRGGNLSWSDRGALAALAGAAALAVVLLWIEARWAAEPLAPARIVGGAGLLPSYLCNFFGLAAGMTMMFNVPLYLQAAQGMSAGEAGLTLIPNVLAGVVGSLAAGLIMQRTGRYFKLTVAETGVNFVGIVLATLMSGVVVYVYSGLIVGLVLMALGNGGMITSTLIALIATAGPADQAIATAVSYLFRSLGSVVGISISGSLIQDTLQRELQRRLTHGDVQEIVHRVRESLSYIDELDPATQSVVRGAYATAVQYAFWFAAVMSGLGFVSSLFIQNKPLPGRGKAK